MIHRHKSSYSILPDAQALLVSLAWYHGKTQSQVLERLIRDEAVRCGCHAGDEMPKVSKAKGEKNQPVKAVVVKKKKY